MDNQSQSQSDPVNNQPQTPAPAKKTHIPILLIILVIFIGAIVALSYKAPRKEEIKQLAPPKIEKLIFAKSFVPLKKYDKKLQLGPFSCPTINSICANGIYKNNSLSGNIGKDSSVYAAFSGTAEGLFSVHPNITGKQEEYYLIVLSNKDKGLIAYYSIKGKAVEKKEVMAGEIIGTSSGAPIDFQGGKSFIFELQKYGENGMIQVSLSKSDFK